MSKIHSPVPRSLTAIPWLAALWCVSYAVLGLLWLRSDTAYPWEGLAALSPLASLGRQTAAGVVIALAVLVAVCLSLTSAPSARRQSVRPARWAATSLIVTGLLVAWVVSDVSALQLLGYLPIIVATTVLGVGPDISVTWDALWPSINALAHAVGGSAVAASGVLGLRRARAACPRCGRGDEASSWASPERARRWGRLATAIACVVPLLYAVTRGAWFLGVPLGVRDEFLTELGAGRWAGLGLATGAVMGSVLTAGLVQRWGEVFPRWLPVLRGRRVPIGLALAPALLVSTVVMSAGVSFLHLFLTGGLERVPGAVEDWAAWAPELLWPLWGLALGAAAIAYWLRRRGVCPRCGREDERESDTSTGPATEPRLAATEAVAAVTAAGCLSAAPRPPRPGR